MYFKNTTIEQMQKALKIVNKKYENNITFNRLEQSGNRIIATLRVKNANVKNGTVKGRKLNQSYLMYHCGMKSNGSACWRVHGEFFEALFSLNGSVEISSSGKFITAYAGNWQDWNIGSIMNPLYYSEACECET